MRNTADFKKLPAFLYVKNNGSGPKFQIFPVLIFTTAVVCAEIPSAGERKEIKTPNLQTTKRATNSTRKYKPLSNIFRRGVYSLSPHETYSAYGDAQNHLSLVVMK